MSTPTGAPAPPGGPAVLAVTVEHARRGVRLQVALRWVLVAFVALTVAFVPPAHDVVACAVIAACYAVFALAVATWVYRGGEWPVRLAWVALLGDLVVLGVLTLLTGVSTPESWTSDVVTTGFLLLPVLAATQLRPRACAVVVIPTVLVYLVAGIATMGANEEPWSSLLLRTAIAAGVAAGCVGISRIERSRVAQIGRLVQTRGELLGELGDLEQRERSSLSEHLHDGALQYVLAARMDLDDARDSGDPEAFERLERALTETSRLLRSTVAELHPAVLAKAGLPAAVRELATTAAARGGFTADVRADGWPADLRTTADPLLHRTARELLANVAEHARARTADVTLTFADGRARMVVADDGAGIGPDAADPGGGHIGLASHAVRIEAAGGRLTLAPGTSSGTVVTVEVPAEPV
ncbi:ATP-binding protein [Pseudonocardia sp. RS11V-5]|uniref:sensor histidine kinase n=1 Tax=Pseudonocardia terrae TaxID=2905831 RepID=UPI001E59ACF2|nr:ATP-binding protein [Pseudonocardia terrae]MCE3552135.1 ATP-binding protein [Pseudonocardia terrae]